MTWEKYLAIRNEIDANMRLKTEYGFFAALRMIDELLKVHPFQPDLLMRKYLAGLLGPDDERPLTELRDCLTLAQNVLPDYVQPQLELSHWDYAMENNSSEAIPRFVKAKHQAWRNLIAAYRGQIKSLVDLDRVNDANRLYARLRAMFTIDSEDDEDEGEPDPYILVWEIGLDCPEVDDT